MNKRPDERPAMLLNGIFAAAQEHGSESDPDHEVGDLQDVLSEVVTQFVPPDRLPDLAEHLAGLDMYECDDCGGTGIDADSRGEGGTDPCYCINAIFNRVRATKQGAARQVLIDDDLARFVTQVAENNGIDAGRYVNSLLERAILQEKQDNNGA